MFIKRIVLSLVALLGVAGNAFAYGGGKAYQYLTLPASAAVSALGGNNVSSHTGDISLVQQNPALLSLTPSSSMSLTYVNYLSDIQYGSLAYGQAIDSLSWWGAGFSYLGYGSFDAYDEFDVQNGTFSASDMNLSLIYVRRLASHFSAGLSLKPVYSHIEDYNSFGLALDFGAVYFLPERNFSAGLAIRNFGVQFSAYDQNRERLPWDVQLGLTKKLEHAPFRFNVTYVKLNEWNLDYLKDGSLYESTSSFVNAEYDSNVSWGDMFMRHMILGLDFVPSKNFSVSAAYNHRRHREFTMPDAGSGSGWSFGANLHVYKFSLGASYAIYGPAGGVFGVTLATKLDDFKKN